MGSLVPGPHGYMHLTSLLLRVIERKSGGALDSGKRKALGAVRPALESYLLAVNLDFIYIFILSEPVISSIKQIFWKMIAWTRDVKSIKSM